MEALTREEKLTKALELIKDGLTYTQISEILGISRGMISGHVSRTRAKKNLPPISKRRQYSPFTKSFNIPDMPEVNDGITIFELKINSCRYMLGKHKYCGHDIALGSYCVTHALMCYKPEKARL